MERSELEVLGEDAPGGRSRIVEVGSRVNAVRLRENVEDCHRGENHQEEHEATHV
jgi:hypothetical protein